MTNSLKIAMLAGSLVMIASGCAAPKGKRGADFPLPGTPMAPSVDTHPAPASPQPASPQPAAASMTSGHPHGTAAQTAMPAHPGGPQESNVAQVGCFAPAQGGCTSGVCGPAGQAGPGGCYACGDAACAPAPHGYAMPCPGPWNAYGIDPQEFICDGGDHPPAAIVRRDDTFGGLQPEDTVVQYTTEAGDIEIEASNRVCLYAPRFAAVRKITQAVAGDRSIGPAQCDRPVGAIRVDQPLPGLVMTDTTELGHADVTRRIDAMRERIRGVPVESILQPEQAIDVMAALIGLTIDELRLLQDEDKALIEQLALAAVVWELDESLEVVIEDLKPPTLTRDEHLQGFTIYEFPDARLEICKLADRSDALPGEVVNFVIRVQNVGDADVEHVVLTDNLTTRLEYVEDSQTCSGGAEFEAFANEGQSLRLQWKLTDKLRVGEIVTIRFRCKVR